MECKHCHKTDDEVTLQKCPICHQYFCHDDAHIYSGHAFCSAYCAEYFFFADEED